MINGKMSLLNLHIYTYPEGWQFCAPIHSFVETNIAKSDAIM